jgi:hypothetical protein
MRRKPTSESLTKKRTAQRRHAKRRFHERFDLQLNRDDIRAVENKIRDGQAPEPAAEAMTTLEH